MAVLTIDPPDPLSLALSPPKDESPAERWAREQREAHARLISEQIDAQIKAEKQSKKKNGKPIKILLLGQSESGKSTTVKNFQLAYAYSSFREERSAWRAVIHLNLVRSVNTVLDILAEETSRTRSRSQSQSPQPLSPRPSPRPSTSQGRPSTSSTQKTSSTGRTLLLPRPSTAHADTLPTFLRTQSMTVESSADSDNDADDDDGDTPVAFPLTERHKVLQLRLTPLRYVQRDLERSLGSASTEAPEGAGDAAPWLRQEESLGHRPREFFVTSRSGWKAALRRVKSGYRRASLGSRDEARVETAEETALSKKLHSRRRSRPTSPFGMSMQAEDEEAQNDGEGEPQAQSAAEVIASCAEDIAALWADADVQAILAHRNSKTRLEEGPGFFLNDVARVAARDYEPSDQDVVRARLRTMGVQEYRFRFERGSEAGREWIIYDVGGARSSRHAWFPYFDDMNALIFLAPISCFDERLAEDRRVNRLQDSFLIWKAICGSKLLQHVHFILFLNKCDLLQKKVSRGVQVVKYIPSYGTRPNESASVARYFSSQFKDIFVKQSPQSKPFYSYMTSVVDTKATAITVAAVRDGIQRNNMKEAEIM
ncbi:uncharacterized protein FIBRA_02884 [Fibroporia radiculosa]|uniref:G-alpha-domain-containing protein n=1 Tax=Fibroporia radiculosa TaxID=599839 RepID=J4HVN2_9APHY|nr:uncharacterized protein FIBRA_02884 [Fibroporia radiculosa]CCM00842.1 predicted protein [Fibroporia radiculosa]